LIDKIFQPIRTRSDSPEFKFKLKNLIIIFAAVNGVEGENLFPQIFNDTI
jgi:hypothetical protein